MSLLSERHTICSFCVMIAEKFLAHLFPVLHSSSTWLPLKVPCATISSDIVTSLWNDSFCVELAFQWPLKYLLQRERERDAVQRYNKTSAVNFLINAF